jgi:hypothetical protein
MLRGPRVDKREEAARRGGRALGDLTSFGITEDGWLNNRTRGKKDS